MGITKCLRIVLLLVILIISSTYISAMRSARSALSENTVAALKYFKQLQEQKLTSRWHHIQEQLEKGEKIDFTHLIGDDENTVPFGEQILELLRPVDFLGIIPKKQRKRDSLKEFLENKNNNFDDVLSNQKQNNFDFDALLKDVALYGNKDDRRLLCSYFNEHSEIIKSMNPENFVFALLQMENSIDKNFEFDNILTNMYLYGDQNALRCLIGYFWEIFEELLKNNIDIKLTNIYSTATSESKIKRPKDKANKEVILEFFKIYEAFFCNKFKKEEQLFKEEPYFNF